MTKAVLKLLGVWTSPYTAYPTKRRRERTYRSSIGTVRPEKLKSVGVLDSDAKAGQKNLIKLTLRGGFTSYVKISFLSILVKLCAHPEDKRVCGCLHLGGIRRGTQRRKRWKHEMFASYFRRGQYVLNPIFFAHMTSPPPILDWIRSRFLPANREFFPGHVRPFDFSGSAVLQRLHRQSWPYEWSWIDSNPAEHPGISQTCSFPSREMNSVSTLLERQATHTCSFRHVHTQHGFPVLEGVTEKKRGSCQNSLKSSQTVGFPTISTRGKGQISLSLWYTGQLINTGSKSGRWGTRGW